MLFQNYTVLQQKKFWEFSWSFWPFQYSGPNIGELLTWIFTMVLIQMFFNIVIVWISKSGQKL